MQKDFTITIGIPAYNEEMNISFLLEDIVRQDIRNFELEQIVVYSDGSDDRTNEIVRSFPDARVRLIEGPGRQGQAVGQNTLFSEASSDAVVLINADMKIDDALFLEKLVAPIRAGEADLTSSNLLPLPPKTFIESVLATGFVIKNILFESYAGGNGLYTCHGAARAFSGRLYHSLRFPRSVGEDAFSYLFCRHTGYVYRYVRDAVMSLRMPATLADHERQSFRFAHGRKNFSESFSEAFIHSETAVPALAYFRGFVRSMPILAICPFRCGMYALLVGFMRIRAVFSEKKLSDTWTISTSSKQVR